jgi:hypothetical protein
MSDPECVDPPTPRPLTAYEKYEMNERMYLQNMRRSQGHTLEYNIRAECLVKTMLSQPLSRTMKANLLANMLKTRTGVGEDFSSDHEELFGFFYALPIVTSV